jgi:hypothetical protein
MHDLSPVHPPMFSVKRRLLVDYRDRESGVPFDYVVRFGKNGVTSYEHVRSVEMKMLALPKITNEMYAVIDIEELNDSLLDGTNNATNRSFCVGFFDSSVLNAGDIKVSKDFYSQKVIFNPPLQKLDRLTIKVLKQNGNVVDVSETNNVSSMTMLLEIETNGRRV